MDLQNGYKALYAETVKTDDGKKKRIYSVSETGLFTDADVIGEVDCDTYKLIYEKKDGIYGSTEATPTNSDTKLEIFDAVFKFAEDVASDPEGSTSQTSVDDNTPPEEPTNEPEDEPEDEPADPEGTEEE